jgi:hypothetical protein
MAAIRFPLKGQFERLVKQFGKLIRTERYSRNKQGKSQHIKTDPNQTHGV